MQDRYLGDGVYASFDGYNVELAVNNHNNKVIILEPEVVMLLSKYFTYIEQLKKDGKETRSETE